MTTIITISSIIVTIHIKMKLIDIYPFILNIILALGLKMLKPKILFDENFQQFPLKRYI